MRRLEAILFDVGGTLLEAPRDPQARAVGAIAHLGGPSPAEFVSVLGQVVAEWHAAGGPPEQEDLQQTWVEHNRRALLRLGFQGDAEAAAHLIEEAFLMDGLTIYPDVVGSLDMLSAAGYKLGVVSNWPATLDHTLEKLGLRKYFSVVIASGVVGYAKPDSRIFRMAADQMGIHAPSTVYVGDSIDHDVAGARSAGMDVVLLQRVDRGEADCRVIRSLTDLHGLLAGE